MASISEGDDLRPDLFCRAVRSWLVDMPHLDPVLATAVALLDATPWEDTPTRFEAHLLQLASDTNESHDCLGADALLSLWRALRTGARPALRPIGVIPRHQGWDVIRTRNAPCSRSRR